MPPRARFDRDYYEMLGVTADAGEDAIRHAYRQLALRWHPDRNSGNPAATERFREISEAYAVLIDPTKRAEYDRVRQLGGETDFGARREDLFRDLFADPRASAIFEELRREMERMGMRVQHRDFRDTLFGGRTVVTGTVIVVSPFTAVTTMFRLARAALRGARPLRGPRPPRPSLLGRAMNVGRWLLGAPVDRVLRAADVVVPLPLGPTEAARGVKKRVTLTVDDAREGVVVRGPAGVRAAPRLRLKGKGRAREDGRRGDAYLAVEITGA